MISISHPSGPVQSPLTSFASGHHPSSASIEPSGRFGWESSDCAADFGIGVPAQCLRVDAHITTDGTCSPIGGRG